MNIAIIAHSYLPDVGGSQETIRGLAKEFSKQAHEVIILVLTPGPGGEFKNATENHFFRFKAFEVIEGIDVHRLRVPFLGVPRIGIKGLIDTLRLLVFLPGVLIKSAKIIKDNKIQIINVHYAGINAFCTWLLSYPLSLKYIVTLQGFNVQVLPFLKGLRGFIIRFVFKSILQRASFVTACSEYLLNDAKERVPQIRNKSCVIPNGIDLDEFKHNGRSLIDYPYILCLGRLHAPFKGFDIALLALKDILDSGLDINLVLAGDGPDSAEYKKLAESLSIEKNVHFFGLANRVEAVYFIKNCQFFVMPSRVEPLGIVNLEAMACSKAVIASRVGGIPEVVEHGVNGLLVEPADVKVLARAIKRLLVDKDLRVKLGRNGRRMLEAGEFSWQRLSRRYLKLYREFL